MTRWQLVHGPSGQTLAIVSRAESWLAKGWGVLGYRSLPPGEGLWLPGVASVHTVGVRFALDLLFLNAEMQTVKSVSNVPPGRWLVRAGGAAHTLELGAGTLAASGIALKNGDGWRLAADARE